MVWGVIGLEILNLFLGGQVVGEVLRDVPRLIKGNYCSC